MELNQTASGKYRFDSIYFKKTISEWVDIINTDISEKNNFKKIHIYPGKYGYDNYVYSLSSILSYLSKNLEDIQHYMKGTLAINKYLELIHKGWKKNYIYWVNNTPYETSMYKKPTKELNTDFRNKNAMLYYNKLDGETQDVYIDIVSSVFKTLGNQIIEDGINNLCLEE
jgi:hypothetical protein